MSAIFTPLPLLSQSVTTLVNPSFSLRHTGRSRGHLAKEYRQRKLYSRAVEHFAEQIFKSIRWLDWCSSRPNCLSFIQYNICQCQVSALLYICSVLSEIRAAISNWATQNRRLVSCKQKLYSLRHATFLTSFSVTMHHIGLTTPPPS